MHMTAKHSNGAIPHMLFCLAHLFSLSTTGFAFASIKLSLCGCWEPTLTMKMMKHAKLITE